MEKNIKIKKIKKIRVLRNFHGSVKDLFKAKKKFNFTKTKLDNAYFVNIKETHFSPLVKYIARLIKSRLLRKKKYYRTKRYKKFKGPKPKRFTKIHKRNFSKIFRFRFFAELKNQPLYFVYLKRFFK